MDTIGLARVIWEAVSPVAVPVVAAVAAVVFAVLGIDPAVGGGLGLGLAALLRGA